MDAVSGFSANGPASVAAALRSAGEATGAGFELLYNMAKRESSLNPMAKARTSTAAGLFQFIEQTWLGAVKNYGGRHGLEAQAAAISQGADGKLTVADRAQRDEILNLRFDPAKAAALAGELAQENRAGLERRLGRAVSRAELYTAHFLGAAGAAKLLTAPADARAADLLPKAAAANRPVFFDGSGAKTVGAVLGSIEQSMNGAAPGGTGPERSAPLMRQASSSLAATGAATLAAGIAAAPALREGPEMLNGAPRASEPVSASPRYERVEAASLRTLPERGREGAGAEQRMEILQRLGAASFGGNLSPLAVAVLQSLDPTRVAFMQKDPATLL